MNTTRSLLQKFGIRKGYNLISLPTITLNPAEADRFIDYTVDQSVMKSFARVERMNGPQKPVRAIGFGTGQFLYPAGQFNESKYKKTWENEKIMLNTQEARGCVPIFDKDVEDLSFMVSEAEYTDMFMRLVAKKIANELELASYSSEKAGLNAWPVDDIRSMWDGWRYRIANSASTQTYYNKVTGSATLMNACEGGTTGSPFRFAGLIAEQDTAAPYSWEFKYAGMIKAMPAIYKQAGLANMKFLNSDLVTQDYLEALSARSTGLGDAVFTGQVATQYGKVEILDVPLMPTTLGDPTASPSTDGKIGAGAYTDVLLTLKGNLIIGIQRDIKIETQRSAADQCTYVFYTLRIDFAVENVNACVLLRCLEHRC